MNRLLKPRSPSLSEPVSPLTLPKMAKDVVYIRVDEIDEKPKLYRRLSDPKPRSLISICDNINCSKVSNNLKICSGCQFNKYCSKKCQQEDWWNHKDLCKSTCIVCKGIYKEFAFKKKLDDCDSFINYCHDCYQGTKIL
jgi:hypothetical protein